MSWSVDEPHDAAPVARHRSQAMLALRREERMADRQAQLMRVLQDLVEKIGPREPTVVAGLASDSAEVGGAPQALCGALALAVLHGSRPAEPQDGLRTDTLPRLVRRSPFADRLQIARSDGLPAIVVHVLSEDPDGAVVVALLQNLGFVLPNAALDALVVRARREPALRSALANRTELARAQAARLASFSSTGVRRRLAERFGPHVLEVLAPEGDDTDDCSVWFSKLHARRELTVATLLVTLRQGREAAFLDGLDRLSGTHLEPEPPRSSAGCEASKLGVDKAALTAFSAAADASFANDRETPR